MAIKLQKARLNLSIDSELKTGSRWEVLNDWLDYTTAIKFIFQ